MLQSFTTIHLSLSLENSKRTNSNPLDHYRRHRHVYCAVRDYSLFTIITEIFLHHRAQLDIVYGDLAYLYLFNDP